MTPMPFVEAPVICPTTFGRDAQLAHLRQVLDQVADGRGSNVLLTGEAGIGKSRLVSETRAHALGRGIRVLQGSAFEVDRALPYGPITDLLRALLSGKSPAEVVDTLGPALVPLARLLPGLGSLLPPREARSHPPAHVSMGAPPPNPHQGNRAIRVARSASAGDDLLAAASTERSQHLLQPLLLVFERLVARGPTLIIIEDIHWADDASLELLLHLTRQSATRPFVLLVTLRPDDASQGVVDWRNTIDRHRLMTEIPLVPLDRMAVEAMVRCIVGDRLTADALQMIAELTEGNPFFIEEVVRTATLTSDTPDRRGGVRVPRSVHDAVQRRTNALSESARRVVQIAAVAGRRFDFDVLQLMLAADERDLLPILKELIAAQLVVEGIDERFAFRHALTREAVYAELLGRERRGLHIEVLAALERMASSADSVPLEELSYHAYAAGEWTKATKYTKLAGDRALSMHAPRAAVEHFAHAINAAEKLGEQPAPEVLRGRAQAYHDLGQFALARADYEAALALATASGDQRLVWQLLVDLNLLWSGRDYAIAGEYAERSLGMARELGDRGYIARSLDRIGNWHLNVGDLPRALEYQRESLQVLESVGDRRGVADTLNLLGMTCAFVDPEQSFAYYARAIPLLRELDERQGLVTALVMRAIDTGFYWGDTLAALPTDVDFARVERDAEEAIRLARSIESPAGESFARWELALWFGPRGYYARALELAYTGLRLAEEIEHTQWICAALCSIGAVYVDVLAPQRARPPLERALALAHELGSQVWSAYAAGRLVMAVVLERDLSSGSAILERELAEDTPFETATQRQLWCARADLLLARGTANDALAIAEKLAATLPEGKIAPRVSILRANALLALGAFDDSERNLVDAIETSRACGLRPQQWRAHGAYARLLRVRGRRDEADVQIQSAIALIEGLAADLVDQDLRSVFVESAVASMPRPGASSDRRRSKLAAHGLTGRENEVATLIGRGMSNRAIAESLVIGERTVESYVSSILAKLGFTARTQIAAWAATRSAPPTSKSPY